MKEILIQIFFWAAILISIFEMYVDYKENKFIIDMLLKKYKYRVAIIVIVALRALTILYL